MINCIVTLRIPRIPRIPRILGCLESEPLESEPLESKLEDVVTINFNPYKWIN